ncbi:MAG TPA: Gfo/Idh/MocA family oxidoreductase, partial [Candidatus Aquilonibacter sp.]|nr:Gfo/Idh/MocA family oxidoreductase [Candidatus Aquilonibacter sp.]
PLRVAVVGAGAISGAYELAMRQMQDAAITAVCDVNRDHAETFAQRAHCRAFASLDALVDSGGFDVAVVCTPPATHEPVACSLLAAGAHVLCEKPLAIDAESAARMLNAASQYGRILTMASKFRFARDVRVARDLTHGGVIGDLVFLENAFTGRVDMRSRWNGDRAVSGGGVLMDNGTHAVDLLRYFMGPLSHVQVVEGRRFQELSVEDTVRLFVRNSDSVMGTSDLSWSIDKHLGSYLRLYGTRGTIVVGWSESKYVLNDSPQWTTFGDGYDKVQAFRDQLANFFAAVRGEADLLVTPLDALASVDVVRAAYDAMERSGWQPVNASWSVQPPALQVS